MGCLSQRPGCRVSPSSPAVPEEGLGSGSGVRERGQILRPRMRGQRSFVLHEWDAGRGSLCPSCPHGGGSVAWGDRDLVTPVLRGGGAHRNQRDPAGGVWKSQAPDQGGSPPSLQRSRDGDLGMLG